MGLDGDPDRSFEITHLSLLLLLPPRIGLMLVGGKTRIVRVALSYGPQNAFRGVVSHPSFYVHASGAEAYDCGPPYWQAVVAPVVRPPQRCWRRASFLKGGFGFGGC